jgi:hypothetical protein
MSQDIEVVRELYRAFAAQDEPTMRRLFDPEVVWHQTGRSVLAGEHRGIDGVLSFFGRVAELSDGTFTADLQSVASGDGHTFAFHTGRGRARGQVLEDRNVLVCHVRDGRVASVWEHHEDLYAVDAFWGTSEG